MQTALGHYTQSVFVLSRPCAIIFAVWHLCLVDKGHVFGLISLSMNDLLEGVEDTGLETNCSQLVTD